MPPEYEFYIAVRGQPEKLLEPLLKMAGCRVGPDGIAEAPGIVITAGKSSPDKAQDIRAAYGIDSPSRLHFRMQASAREDSAGLGPRTLIKAAGVLLTTLPEDSLLTTADGAPLLLRRKGNLILNKDCGWWDEAGRLDLLELPFTVSSLRSI